MNFACTKRIIPLHPRPTATIRTNNAIDTNDYKLKKTLNALLIAGLARLANYTVLSMRGTLRLLCTDCTQNTTSFSACDNNMTAAADMGSPYVATLIRTVAPQSARPRTSPTVFTTKEDKKNCRRVLSYIPLHELKQNYGARRPPQQNPGITFAR